MKNKAILLFLISFSSFYLLCINIYASNNTYLQRDGFRGSKNKNLSVCTNQQWSKVKKTLTIRYKNIQGIIFDNYQDDDLLTIQSCLMTTRNIVLFDKSLVEPHIEVKKCNGQLCCKVIQSYFYSKPISVTDFESNLCNKIS